MAVGESIAARSGSSVSNEFVVDGRGNFPVTRWMCGLETSVPNARWRNSVRPTGSRSTAKISRTP